MEAKKMRAEPIDISPQPLTTRGEELFEYLVGYVIQDAYKQVGKQPRRSVTPLLELLKSYASYVDQQFEVYAGKKVDQRLTIGLAEDAAFSAGWDVRFPADWSETFRSSAERLLGQRYLQQVNTGKKGARGKRDSSEIWKARIQEIASACKKRDDPSETLGKFVQRVYDVLVDRTDAGDYETFEERRMAKAPSKKTVQKRLKELGYRRGAYP